MRRWIAARTTLLAAALALGAPGAVFGEEVSDSTSPWTLVRMLSNAERSTEAAEALVALGSRSIGALDDVASNRDADLLVRGEAMTCLARIGGEDAIRIVRRILSCAEERPLARLWAAGALARLSPGEAPGDLAAAIPTAAGSRLEPALVELLVASAGPEGAHSLVRVCLTDPNDGARRTAAGILGTPQIDGTPARRAYLDALSYDPLKESVSPWQGGALYIPGVGWDASESRELVATLVHWLLWSGGRGDAPSVQQVGNNLRSIGLLNAAGLGWDRGFWDGYGVAWTLVCADRWEPLVTGPDADPDLRRALVALLRHALRIAPEDHRAEIAARIARLG